MSEWAWVTFGFAVTYVTLFAYAAWLRYRVRNAEAELEELR